MTIRLTHSIVHGLMVFLGFGCSALEKSPKFAFTDGVYKATVPGIEDRRMYVEVEDDSVLVFPLVPGVKGVQIDSTRRVQLLFPEYRSGDSFRNVTFYKPTLDLDILTIPFKYRPRAKEIPRQLVSSVEAAVYLGYRLDAYHLHYSKTPRHIFNRTISHFGFSLGLFTGLGTSEITPWFTQDQIAYEYSGITWTKGLAGMIGVNNFTIGLSAGVDWLLDRNRQYWIYQHQPWVGLAFGLNLN